LSAALLRAVERGYGDVDEGRAADERLAEERA
jgi:hypothetical protein